MLYVVYLFTSFMGVMGGANIIETLNPIHSCQEHACENESVLSITSPNGVSTFHLIAQQLERPVNQSNIEDYIIDQYNLSSTSSDLDFMMAVAYFYNEDVHSSWDAPEVISGIVFDPVYSLLNFSSMQCGEFVSNSIILVNRIRSKLNLPPLNMRKAWLTGHTVMEFFDNQHQKWIYFDLDGAGGHLLLVSDENGFYASLDEIVNNPSLVLSNEGVVFLHPNDGLSASCIKEIFYESANDLFQSINYTEVLDTIKPIKRTGITIDANVTVDFYDNTGDYWWFDTTGLIDALNLSCDSAELALMNSMEPDSGCGDDLFIECLFDGLAEINDFESLNELMDFLQYSNYYSFELGTPFYKKTFREGAEFFMVKMLPGEYDSLTNYYVGYLVKKLTPEKTGIDFMFNDKIYNGSFEINKYVERNNVDTLWQNAQNFINEVGYAASIPSELGSLTVEYYMNYHLFPFMDTIQSILVESGDLVLDQSFKFNDMDTANNPVSISVNQSIDNNISIFPNPTNGFVQIETDQELNEIRIIDQLGRTVYHSFGAYTLDLTLLPEGLYFINITSEYGTYSAKIERKN